MRPDANYLYKNKKDFMSPIGGGVCYERTKNSITLAKYCNSGLWRWKFFFLDIEALNLLELDNASVKRLHC